MVIFFWKFRFQAKVSTKSLNFIRLGNKHPIIRFGSIIKTWGIEAISIIGFNSSGKTFFMKYFKMA